MLLRTKSIKLSGLSVSYLRKAECCSRNPASGSVSE